MASSFDASGALQRLLLQPTPVLPGSWTDPGSSTDASIAPDSDCSGASPTTVGEADVSPQTDCLRGNSLQSAPFLSPNLKIVSVLRVLVIMQKAVVDPDDLCKLVVTCKEQLLVLLQELCFRVSSSQQASRPEEIFGLYAYHFQRIQNTNDVADLYPYLTIFGPCLSANRTPVRWNISAADYLELQLEMLQLADEQQLRLFATSSISTNETKEVEAASAEEGVSKPISTATATTSKSAKNEILEDKDARGRNDDDTPTISTSDSVSSSSSNSESRNSKSSSDSTRSTSSSMCTSSNSEGGNNDKITINGIDQNNSGGQRNLLQSLSMLTEKLQVPQLPTWASANPSSTELQPLYPCASQEDLACYQQNFLDLLVRQNALLQTFTSMPNSGVAGNLDAVKMENVLTAPIPQLRDGHSSVLNAPLFGNSGSNGAGNSNTSGSNSIIDSSGQQTTLDIHNLASLSTRRRSTVTTPPRRESVSHLTMSESEEEHSEDENTLMMEDEDHNSDLYDSGTLEYGDYLEHSPDSVWEAKHFSTAHRNVSSVPGSGCNTKQQRRRTWNDDNDGLGRYLPGNEQSQIDVNSRLAEGVEGESTLLCGNHHPAMGHTDAMFKRDAGHSLTSSYGGQAGGRDGMSSRRASLEQRQKQESSISYYPNAYLSEVERDYRRPMCGVSYNSRKAAWLAYWSTGKSFKLKRFPVKKLGFHYARTEAINCRLEAERNGACMLRARRSSDRHGMQSNIFSLKQQHYQQKQEVQRAAILAALRKKKVNTARGENLRLRAEALQPVEGVRFDPQSLAWIGRFVDEEGGSQEPRQTKFLVKTHGFLRAREFAIQRVRRAGAAVSGFPRSGDYRGETIKSDSVGYEENDKSENKLNMTTRSATGKCTKCHAVTTSSSLDDCQLDHPIAPYVSSSMSSDEFLEMRIDGRANPVDFNVFPDASQINTSPTGPAYFQSFSIGKGVRYSTHSDTWVGDIMVQGRRLTQHFPVKKLGWDEAQRKAVEWRKEMEQTARMSRQEAATKCENLSLKKD